MGLLTASEEGWLMGRAREGRVVKAAAAEMAAEVTEDAAVDLGAGWGK